MPSADCIKTDLNSENKMPLQLFADIIDKWWISALRGVCFVDEQIHIAIIPTCVSKG